MATNIVIFFHPDPDALLRGLAEQGVLAGTVAPGWSAWSPMPTSTTQGIEFACEAIVPRPPGRTGTGPWPTGRRTCPATVLAVYAHPDDPDVSAGGTLARWAAAGAAVHVCICADGDKGSSDPATDPTELVARRRQEVAASGAILGVKAHHWLGFRDGELDDDRALRARLVALVREVRPDVVVAPDPTAIYFGQHYVNHRDHRVVGWAALDAVAPAAANPHYFPDAGPGHAGRCPLPVGDARAGCVGRHLGDDRHQGSRHRLPRQPGRRERRVAAASGAPAGRGGRPGGNGPLRRGLPPPAALSQ